jgi:hypothetical protein
MEKLAIAQNEADDRTAFAQRAAATPGADVSERVRSVGDSAPQVRIHIAAVIDDAGDGT